ncbi:MAG: STAS domain-containing protein [bacterium]|nr:STAS domain-containing protein [bacterium]
MSSVVKDVRRAGEAVIVAAQGEIDLRCSPDFHRALAKVSEERPPILIVNLGEVTYMDSSGVGTLVEIFRRTKEYGGHMVLVGLTERVLSVFEITKLDRFFTIKASEAEALDAVPGSD